MRIKQLLLLTKRLFKKPTFIVLLIMIPAIVTALRAVEKEDSGFLYIKLAVDGKENAETDAIFDELMKSSELVSFEAVSPSEAIEAVEMGRADSAWIFPEDISGRIDDYSKSRDAADYVVSVYEREPSVVLQLVHEKLSGVLYEKVSERLYINYIRDNIPELDSVSESSLFDQYNSYDTIDNLFEFSYPDGSGPVAIQAGYMTAPLRGLLGIVVTLGALAGAMYYIEDSHRGVFFKVKPRTLVLVEFSSVFVCSLSLGIFTSAALFLAGLSRSLANELLLTIVLSVSSTLFAMMVNRMLCGNIKVMATLTPLIVCVMAVVCPVFVDMGSLRALQSIFPATYYINSVNNASYITKSALYIVVLAALVALLEATKILVKKIKASR